MSRRAGTTPEKTRADLIKAATAEFQEYGFEKASLRRICANAGVTTGAMYSCFENKEDMFTAVVSPVMNKIQKLLDAHFKSEMERQSEDEQKALDEDIQASEDIINAFYANKELMEIILNNRERASVIQFFDRIAEMLDQQTRYISNTETGVGDSDFNECTVHWFSHLQIDMILHIISHDYPKERAIEQLRIMVKFIRGGFMTLVRN